MRVITRIVGAGFAFGLLLAMSVWAADDPTAMDGGSAGREAIPTGINAGAVLRLDTLRTYLDKRPIAEAWALAEKLHNQYAGNPDFDFLFARAALAASYPSQAIFALERVRWQRPGHQQAWLLLVRAHLAAGDPANARRELDALLHSNPAPAIRAESQTLGVPMGTEPATARPVRGFVGLDVGYDSNVNSATDASSVGGVGGDPTVGVILAPGDRALHDSLARLSVGYGGDLPLGSQTSLFTDAYGYVNALYDQTQFNTSLYQGRVGASWQAGAHRLTLPVSRQIFSVDHRRYSSYDMAALEWTYTASAAQRWRLAGSRGLASYDNQPTRDARTTSASLGWSLGAGRARFGASARYGQDDPRVDSFGTPAQSNAFIGRHTAVLGFDTSYRLWPRHVPRLSVLFQDSRHDDSDPVFVVVRHDQYALVMAGWDWRAWPGWLWRAEVSYAINRSNIDLYDFDRTQILLGVRHDLH